MPILLWAITKKCEKALDRYEGYPSLYRKETLQVKGITWMANGIIELQEDITEVSAMIYIMNMGEAAPTSDYYLGTIVGGYRSVGFHVRYLAEAVRRTLRLKAKRSAARGKQWLGRETGWGGQTLAGFLRPQRHKSNGVKSDISANIKPGDACFSWLFSWLNIRDSNLRT